MSLNKFKNKSESRIQVGDSIITRNSGWKFDNEVVANFESHVRRSIPLYETGHQLVCELSDFFIHDGSLCYELGTSVGELIEKVALQNSHKKIKFVGVDIDRILNLVLNLQGRQKGHSL